MNPDHSLGQLISGVMTANGWSYADLEARARKAGHTRRVSRQNLQRIATKYPVEEISAEQMRALSDATGLPLRTLVVAALASAGIRIANDEVPLVERVQSDPDLPEEAKQAIVAIIAPYKKRKSQARPGNVSALKQRPRTAPERGRPYLLDEAAREDTGEPYPGGEGE